MMQYEHGSAQPVWTRNVNAVRPATPGSMAAPQLPSPSPNRSAVVGDSVFDPLVRVSSPRSLAPNPRKRIGLSSLATTRTTFGNAASSSGLRVA